MKQALAAYCADELFAEAEGRVRAAVAAHAATVPLGQPWSVGVDAYGGSTTAGISHSAERAAAGRRKDWCRACTHLEQCIGGGGNAHPCKRGLGTMDPGVRCPRDCEP